MNQAPHVAIVGATGAVGVEILSCLETRNFPVGSLKLLASARSAGKQVAFRGEMLTVEELTEKSFEGVDIALFSAGGGISLKFAPIAAAAGCVVIDNSSAFRQDPDVPLVVPEINPEAAFNHPRNIIANPNCTTIITLMALFPLHQQFGLKTVIASSYRRFQAAASTASRNWNPRCAPWWTATPWSRMFIRTRSPSICCRRSTPSRTAAIPRKS